MYITQESILRILLLLEVFCGVSWKVIQMPMIFNGVVVIGWGVR